MTVVEEMERFSGQFGKRLVVNRASWHYYRLGTGPPVLWLTGGLRRAALGFAFMERLAAHHTVIAPDYPPVRTVDEFMIAFDGILRTESIDTFALGGQSYGGLLAQAYLAHRTTDVDRLILSSTGPADYGRAWLPAEKVFMVLARILPERTVKGLLAGGLLRAITLPEAERAEWVEAIKSNRAQRSVPCRRGLAFCRCLRPDPHWRRDPRRLPYLDRSHRRPQRRERSDAEQEGCSALHEPVWSRHRRDQPGPSGARRCTGRPE
jgi:pimeloyl-ACP methyl ester carboxylesterase